MKRLSQFFGVLSNPRRVRIIEELKESEKDVSTLAASLDLHQSSISKHLAILRAHRIVVERKEGRNSFYRLCDKELASWILDGAKFAGPNRDDARMFLLGLEQAKSAWIQQAKEK